jgi:ketosteroid isomerase-like protein
MQPRVQIRASRRRPRRLVLLLFLLAFASPHFAVATAGFRQKPKDIILSLEQQWRAASLSGDSAEIDKLLSDDYVGISWNGQVSTKAMQLDHIRTHNFILSKLDVSDVKVKVVGPIAIVTSTADIEGINDGSPMHGTFRYTRIYQRLPQGTWKITNFEATRVPGPGEHNHHQH